jgi:hypothetical protein
MNEEIIPWGGGCDVAGPDTRYQMLWHGAWRPVVNMLDTNNVPTTLTIRCAKAVLFVGLDYWVAVAVSPGDIVERFDRDPKRRRWETVD